MAVRKTLSKRVRFEIFKRDSFTCRYCGAQAPTVVLEIDHIEPVAKGGSNHALNLITSCSGCNRGKSDRRLDDNSMVTRQRLQAAEAQERAEQIRMMARWQRELLKADDLATDACLALWNEQALTFRAPEEARRELKRLINRFGAAEVMTAVRIACITYVQSENGLVTQESATLAWQKIGGICVNRKRDLTHPHLRDVFRIRAILRNRFSYVDLSLAKRLLERAIEAGAEVDRLERDARDARHWSEWREGIEGFLERAETHVPSEAIA